jgi:hypothetical protein
VPDAPNPDGGSSQVSVVPTILSGADERLQEVIGVSVYLYYEPHRSPYESTVATVRSQMGEEDFEKAPAEGREMTFEEAVVYGLEDDEVSATQTASGLAVVRSNRGRRQGLGAHCRRRYADSRLITYRLWLHSIHLMTF